jgi:hypothetical protein
LPIALQEQLFTFFGNYSRPLPFPSTVSAIDKGLHRSQLQMVNDADELRSSWKRFQEIIEDDRFDQRRLFRWHE